MVLREALPIVRFQRVIRNTEMLTYARKLRSTLTFMSDEVQCVETPATRSSSTFLREV